MNEKYTYYLRYACISSALAAALALGGCSSGERGVATQNEAVAANAQDGQAAVSDGTDETIAPLGMDGQILPGLDDVELPEDAQAAPQYLREGVRHEIVKKLQQRLMDLGFMDNDEYFGYRLGALEYRSVRFETETLDCDNYQGNAVVNYTDGV